MNTNEDGRGMGGLPVADERQPPGGEGHHDREGTDNKRLCMAKKGGGHVPGDEVREVWERRLQGQMGRVGDIHHNRLGGMTVLEPD